MFQSISYYLDVIVRYQSFGVKDICKLTKKLVVSNLNKGNRSLLCCFYCTHYSYTVAGLFEHDLDEIDSNYNKQNKSQLTCKDFTKFNIYFLISNLYAHH